MMFNLRNDKKVWRVRKESMCNILNYWVNVLINDILYEYKNKSYVVKWLDILFRREFVILKG